MTFVEEGTQFGRVAFSIYPHPDLLDDLRHKLLTARMVFAHQGCWPNWLKDIEGKKIEIYPRPPEVATIRDRIGQA